MVWNSVINLHIVDVFSVDERQLMHLAVAIGGNDRSRDRHLH